MFKTMFKRREFSGEKAPENEEKPVEAEAPGEDIPAQPVQAENAPLGELEAVPDAEEGEPDTRPDSIEKQPEEAQEPEMGSLSLSSLFSQTGQYEESGISALLDLVPDTTIQELLGDLEEIKGILRGLLPES